MTENKRFSRDTGGGFDRIPPSPFTFYCRHKPIQNNDLHPSVLPNLASVSKLCQNRSASTPRALHKLGISSLAAGHTPAEPQRPSIPLQHQLSTAPGLVTGNNSMDDIRAWESASLKSK